MRRSSRTLAVLTTVGLAHAAAAQEAAPPAPAPPVTPAPPAPPAAPAAPAAAQAPERLVLRVLHLSHLQADEAARVLRPFLGEHGTVSVHPGTNSLLLQAPAASAERVARAAAEIDRPVRRVLVEAAIVDATLRDGMESGIDLSSVLSDANTTATVAVRAAGGTPLLSGVVLPRPGAEGAVLARSTAVGDIAALIRLLAETTEVHTKAHPKLLVDDHESARLHVGERRGYTVVRSSQTALLEEVRFQDSGVLLTLTPHVSGGDSVTLHIRPEVSEDTSQARATTATATLGRLSGLASSTLGGVSSLGGYPISTRLLPSKRTQELGTVVTVKSGATIVLGGLLHEVEEHRDAGVPFLKDIPVIGLLFRHSETVEVKRELLVMLTPHIVEPGAPLPGPPPEEEADDAQ